MTSYEKVRKGCEGCNHPGIQEGVTAVEYQVLDLSAEADLATRMINEMAAEGWELMQVVALPGFAASGVGGRDSSLYAVFRRPYSEDSN